MSANDAIYNTFIQEIIDLADTLDNYISGLTNQPVSTIDLLTLVAAILAVIVSGVSIYVTNKVDKKNRESNEKIAEQVQVAEDKRAHAAIDANLTANARIEWIQNVRQATAELITSCYRYIWSEQDELKKNLEAAQEKKALFVLYFGPDEPLKDWKFDQEEKAVIAFFNCPKEDSSAESNTSRLLDEETNKRKNNSLVLFIDELYSGLNRYHHDHLQLEYCREELRKCNSCYSYDEDVDHCPSKVYKCEKDQYGTQFTEKDREAFKIEQSAIISEYEKYERDLFSKLQELSEIMRIYLKIEWNRAKERK